MKTLFQEILESLKQDKPVELVAILASGGSTPRGTGAMMAVFSGGKSSGTIGGGNVEFASQKLALELLQQKKCAIRQFNFTPGDAANLGMVCGGDVVVQFRYLAAEGNNISVFQELLSAIAAEHLTWLALNEDENIPLQVISHEAAEDFRAQWKLPAHLLESLPRHVESWLAIPVVHEGHLYLFGGGHVAQALVPIASGAGFNVIVYDDRPEFSNAELFPQATATICADFSEIEQNLTITDKDYIVIMTRGHLADYVVLEKVLRSNAKYIGCIGSHRKLALCREHLLSSGYTAQECDAVYAPIGLNIGAETPFEIAVSVTAELIAIRSGLDPRSPSVTTSLSARI